MHRVDHAQGPGAARPGCAGCGGRIGVYEPVICLSGAGARRSSLAAEPDLSQRCERLFHAACYEPAPGGQVP